ncbi:Hpt domain-containing protein [Verrucomicrobiaceae bacterium R5-34]|nr:Hpt domain-containing protein [Verrucomicrobiaceae bacterium R5-34]
MDVEVDEAQLLALAGNDREMVLAIVADFLEDGRRLIGGVVTAQAAGEEAEVKGYLHQLKGASGSLGMKSLYELCVKMEGLSAVDLSTESLKSLRHQHEQSVQFASSCLRG